MSGRGDASAARAALRRHQARSPYRSATYNDCADNPIAPDVS